MNIGIGSVSINRKNYRIHVSRVRVLTDNYNYVLSLASWSVRRLGFPRSRGTDNFNIPRGRLGEVWLRTLPTWLCHCFLLDSHSGEERSSVL